MSIFLHQVVYMSMGFLHLPVKTEINKQTCSLQLSDSGTLIGIPGQANHSQTFVRKGIMSKGHEDLDDNCSCLGKHCT